MNDIRPLIDSYTENYLHEHHEGEIELSEVEGLYEDMGNVLLKEMEGFYQVMKSGAMSYNPSSSASLLDLFDSPKGQQTTAQIHRNIDIASKKYLHKIAYLKMKARTEKNYEK